MFISAAETSLDDASYDAQTAGSGGIIDGAADGEEPPAAAESSAAASQGQQEEAAGENGSSKEPGQQQENGVEGPKKKKTQFDRLLSSVFEDAGGSDKLRSGAGSRAGGGSARWQQKLNGSYLRRAVSARFAGKSAGGGKAAEEGGEQRGGAAKAALPAGKSGAPSRGSLF